MKVDDKALLAKKIKNVLQFRKSKNKYKTHRTFELPKNEFSERYKGRKEQNYQVIKHHECFGYGHVKAKCPNYLKSNSKDMNATKSSDEYKGNESNQACLD